MLRAILPSPRSLLGCIPLNIGAAIIAALLTVWHGFGIATGYRSPWVLYSIWMAVSSVALFYGQHKKDHGHVRWFAMALFIDMFVYIGYIPYDRDFTMTDVESCQVAMSTNRDMTMEYCLEHVHEIRQIAYVMRVAAVLAKGYMASVAKSYEDSVKPKQPTAASKKRS
ncbi:hypothetical protein EC988_004871 [Linderina pennispora]|nr:hypothetical protein EC988_004871 [Linderina pennispora]